MTITSNTLSSTHNNRPIVSLTSGTVQGESTDQYDVYRGIPYAQAPVGDLRFQLPIPPKPWDGIFDATLYGIKVPQSPLEAYAPIFEFETKIRTDDNWLTVNIWSPKNAYNAPVFVWIHGGSFTHGSSAELIYAGDTFARNGIVYVSINYRLGIEGFGIFPDAPHNRGTADQILALRWVQENIAAFGGDPHTVTIGGQSAGSMSVGTIITSPQAQGLFHRAILQSGAPILLSAQAGAKYVQEVAKELDTQPTAKHFTAYTPEQILSAMTTIALKPENTTQLLVCSPVVDGKIVPENPNDILCEQPSTVPLLMGYTANEFALWTRVLKIIPDITWEIFPTITAYFGIKPEVIHTYQEYYQPNHTAEEAITALISDMIFVIPIHRIIKAQSENTYAYIFSWHNDQNNFMAFHALDLPFMFNHLKTKIGSFFTGKSAPQELADHMHTSWVNFVKTGNPGWDTAGATQQFYEFNYPIAPFEKLIQEPRAKLLEIWDA